MVKILPLVLVAAIVIAAGMLARSVFGLFMEPPVVPDVTDSGPAGFITAAAGRSLADYADILRLNPFGEGPAGELTPLGAEPSAGAAVGSGQAPQEGGPFSLAGTIVEEGGYRFAIFERGDGSGGEQVLVGEGAAVPGVGHVASIEPGTVVIETTAGRKTVHVRDISAVDRKSPAGTAYRDRGRKPRSKARLTGGTDGIRQIGDSTFRLSKEGIKAALKNPQQIMTEARMLPYITDGAQEGFIVREVKKGGIYEELGLENGDILLRVNDLALKSPDSALQAFGALQGLDKIQLEIVRRGDNRTLVYHIE